MPFQKVSWINFYQILRHIFKNLPCVCGWEMRHKRQISSYSYIFFCAEVTYGLESLAKRILTNHNLVGHMSSIYYSFVLFVDGPYLALYLQGDQSTVVFNVKLVLNNFKFYKNYIYIDIKQCTYIYQRCPSLPQLVRTAVHNILITMLVNIKPKMNLTVWRIYCTPVSLSFSAL